MLLRNSVSPAHFPIVCGTSVLHDRAASLLWRHCLGQEAESVTLWTLTGNICRPCSEPRVPEKTAWRMLPGLRRGLPTPSPGLRLCPGDTSAGQADPRKESCLQEAERGGCQQVSEARPRASPQRGAGRAGSQARVRPHQPLAGRCQGMERARALMRDMAQLM